MNGEEWDNTALVKEYVDKLQSHPDWYEDKVNIPSLLSLIPHQTKTILDFGSGPGSLTSELANLYKTEGADRSQMMIDTAASRYPNISFWQWDGQESFPSDKKFDVIISKLTIHFVEDLNVFARHCYYVLNPHGSIVVSVQHPLRAMKKVRDDNYIQQAKYPGGSNKYGLRYQMIHRSFEGYIKPFLENGFIMTGLLEPVIPETLIKAHDAPEADNSIPKRLNLRFERI